jgi:hypothetical protein
MNCRPVLAAIAEEAGVTEMAVSVELLLEKLALPAPPHPARPVTKNDAKRMKQILFLSI